MEDIRKTLERFIEAFNGLRLEDMMKEFSEDATSFFPITHHLVRLMGREEIMAAFQKVIDKMKAAGLNKLSMVVEDLDIRDYGDVAVATFHIRDNMLSRRTLVLSKVDDRWLITHLHASNAPLEGGE